MTPTNTSNDIGKPHAKPTPRREWASVGDTVTATDGPCAMPGIVERVTPRLSCPTATVKWSNGSVGRHTITTLRKRRRIVVDNCGACPFVTGELLGRCSLAPAHVGRDTDDPYLVDLGRSATLPKWCPRPIVTFG